MYLIMLSDVHYAVIDYCARNLVQVSSLNKEDSPIPGTLVFKNRIMKCIKSSKKLVLCHWKFGIGIGI